MRWTWAAGLLALGLIVTGSGIEVIRWLGSEADTATRPMRERGLPDILRNLPHDNDREWSEAFETRLQARFADGTPAAALIAALHGQGFAIARAYGTWRATFVWQEPHCRQGEIRCRVYWSVEWQDDGHGRIKDLSADLSRPEPPPNLGGL